MKAAKIGSARYALRSLTEEDSRTALACLVFTSLPMKLRCMKALKQIEDEPGFAGWGRFLRLRRRTPVGGEDRG